MLRPKRKLAEKKDAGILDVILISDSDGTSETEAKSGADRTAAAAMNAREAAKEEEMSASLTCTICYEIFYKCVILQPCIHCFCGGCYSEWMVKSNECPQCRANVQHIAPNHVMNNVVETFLKLNPGSRRAQSDLDEQDKKNRVVRAMAFPSGLKRFYPFDGDDYNEDEDEDYEAELDDDVDDDPYEYASTISYGLSSDPGSSVNDDNDNVDISDDVESVSSGASLSNVGSLIDGEWAGGSTPSVPSPRSDIVISSEDTRSESSDRLEADGSLGYLSSSSEDDDDVGSHIQSPIDLSHVGDSSSSSDSSDAEFDGRCRQCPEAKRRANLRKWTLDSGAGSSGGSGGDGSLRGRVDYTCTRGQVHLMCLCCRGLMPRRTVVDTKDGTIIPPQSCSNCFSLYCNMYWGCRGPNCDGCLEPFARLNFANGRLGDLINGNFYETQILYEYLRAKGMDWMDLFRVCVRKLRRGTFGITASLEVAAGETSDQLVDRVLCKSCGLKVFGELAFQFREDILNEDLPRVVTEREDCYWGSNCRSQHKFHHAERFNHICVQTRHSDK